MSDLQFQKFELGPIGTNAFLIWEENGTDAVLIDAPPDAKSTIEPMLKLRGLQLSALWLTHGHWDHMAGAAELTSGDMAGLGHKDDLELFENPECMSSFAMPGMDFQPIQVTQWVSNGDKLDLFGRVVDVLHVPGHCPGNVAFHIPSKGWCFVGDAIFAGSIGRIFTGVISPHWKNRSRKNSILSRDLPLFIRGTDRIQLSKVKW
ncbi:MAG: MBL fold metallo-hydrolase [Verrucomicrobia bacterium]|nr:MBL fold metallo-hydrolase [Verrucomicrobiota bacterium]